MLDLLESLVGPGVLAIGAGRPGSLAAQPPLAAGTATLRVDVQPLPPEAAAAPARLHRAESRRWRAASGARSCGRQSVRDRAALAPHCRGWELRGAPGRPGCAPPGPRREPLPRGAERRRAGSRDGSRVLGRGGRRAGARRAPVRRGPDPARRQVVRRRRASRRHPRRRCSDPLTRLLGVGPAVHVHELALARRRLPGDAEAPSSGPPRAACPSARRRRSRQTSSSPSTSSRPRTFVRSSGPRTPRGRRHAARPISSAPGSARSHATTRTLPGPSSLAPPACLPRARPSVDGSTTASRASIASAADATSSPET